MKKLLLALPLLLAACAPAVTAPKPAPGEVVVSYTSSSASSLSPEELAGVGGFAAISALLIILPFEKSGLTPGYDGFTFPDGEHSMNMISAKGDPIHVKVDWRATQPLTKSTVDVQWESRPVGGNFLVIKLKAQTTDPDINPRKVEDALMREFLNVRGVRLVASGR